MIVAIGIIVALVIFVVLASNRLTGQKNRVEQSQSNIDVYLEKRFDEMSSLLEQLMLGYEHESSVYEAISKARSGIDSSMSGTPQDRVKAYNGVTAMLANPGFKTEAYPELNAIKQLATFAMNSTSANERDILAARKAYNSNVTAYRNVVEMFPTSMIAGLKGYKSTDYELLVVADYKREAPSALKIHRDMHSNQTTEQV